MLCPSCGFYNLEPQKRCVRCKKPLGSPAPSAKLIIDAALLEAAPYLSEDELQAVARASAKPDPAPPPPPPNRARRVSPAIEPAVTSFETAIAELLDADPAPAEASTGAPDPLFTSVSNRAVVAANPPAAEPGETSSVEAALVEAALAVAPEEVAPAAAAFDAVAEGSYAQLLAALETITSQPAEATDPEITAEILAEAAPEETTNPDLLPEFNQALLELTNPQPGPDRARAASPLEPADVFADRAPHESSQVSIQPLEPGADEATRVLGRKRLLPRLAIFRRLKAVRLHLPQAVLAKPRALLDRTRHALEQRPAARRVLAGVVDFAVWAALGLVLGGAAVLLTGSRAPDARAVELMSRMAPPFALMMALLVALYDGLFGSLLGKTPGMMLFKLRLVGEDGGPPRMGSALLRSWIFMLGLAPLGIGTLLLVTKNPGAWRHDLATGLAIRPEGLAPRREGAKPNEDKSF